VCRDGACFTYTESEFKRYKKDAKANGFIFKSGKIYYNDSGDPQNPNYVLYGTYVSDMNPLGAGVAAELSERNASFQIFGEVTMTAENFLIGGLTTLGPVGAASLGLGTTTSVAPGVLTGSLSGLTQSERLMVGELLNQGKNVEIIERSTVQGVKTADWLVDGVTTEFKTLESAGTNTLKNAIQRAAKQGQQILIDARNVGITPQAAAQQIQRAQGNIGGLVGRVTVLTKGGIVSF
jgi:hypothetical protein